jgi:hypothetical protein
MCCIVVHTPPSGLNRPTGWGRSSDYQDVDRLVHAGEFSRKGLAVIINSKTARLDLNNLAEVAAVVEDRLGIHQKTI